MKRFILIAFIALALVACDLPAPTPTEEPGATDTPTATLEVVTPSPSATITLTPTDTATVVPTSTPVPVYTERLENGDFEGLFDLWLQYGGFVGEHWYPVVWRDFPIPRICEDGQTTGCNPDGLTTRNPEYKPGGGDPFRVFHGVNSQQFFCSGEHCFAGVAQDFPTAPGDDCNVSAWVQTWGAGGGRSNVSNELYRSDYATDDDKDNMHFMIVVNPAGDGITFPFPDSYLVAEYGYADGIYDEPSGGAPISLQFTATGEKSTVAFIGYQIFPVGNANWYIDYATAWCLGQEIAPVEEITPTPIATPVAEASVFVVEAQGLESDLSNDILKENIMDFDWNVLLTLVVTLLGLVPLVGGGVGNLISAVTDLVKAALHSFGVELPEGLGGIVFLGLNFAAFVGIFLIAGVHPAEYVLPEETAATIALVVNIIAAVTGLLGSLALGDLTHKLLRKYAEKLVSIKARNQGKA